MTSMNVCVLEYTDKLFCRDIHYEFVPKFIVNAKPDTKTAQDLFDNINRARYPRNLDYYDNNLQRVRRRPQTPQDFSFWENSGVPLKYASANDITKREAPEGAIIIDLKNNKIINLSHSSPLGLRYLGRNTIIVRKSENDPTARNKYDECRNDGLAHYECVEKAYHVSSRLPRGFDKITIDIEGFSDRGKESEAEEFINKLRKCNHPSGELYRSIGGCLEEDWYPERNI